MAATSRTTVTMPRARFEQLEAIARHRSLPSPGALIEAWISRAIAEGEIKPQLPGLMCQRIGADFLVSIHDKALPAIPADRARLLASVLSAAGGEADPVLSFTMPAGKPVVLDLGDHQLSIARAGTSVRLTANAKDGEGGMLSSVSRSFAVELARTIRREFGETA